MTTELAGENHNFVHPVDALNHMADNHLLEKMACYDPKPDRVTKMLRHVVSYFMETKISCASIYLSGWEVEGLNEMELVLICRI